MRPVPQLLRVNVVEAFFFPRGDEFIHHPEGNEERARTARQAFLTKFKHVDPAAVPLLAFDIADSRNGRPPFRFAEEPPPDEATMCSCPDIADRTSRARYRVLCKVCPY